MEEKIISSIDPARFMRGCEWNFKHLWSGKVDVSTWLKVKMQPGGRVYLLLEYQDQVSQRAVPVDRCLSKASDSILLNGRISLSGQGELKIIRLSLKFEACDADSIVCEELSVNPVKAKATRNNMRMVS